MRADCHVHIDRIGGPHRTQPPTPEQFADYAAREGISLVCAIYERDDVLERFQPVGVQLFPFYWERQPLSPTIPPSARGLKLHPFIEQYPLELVNVAPSLDVAQARGLPVLIHMEDRRPELSHGEQVDTLAREYPSVLFIMAHSGSYAPVLVGDPGTVLIQDAVVRELVSEAIGVAMRRNNVMLETSVLAHPLKAGLIARVPPEKLLLGSDFPISMDHFGSIQYSERMLVAAGMPAPKLEQIHQHAFSLFAA